MYSVIHTLTHTAEHACVQLCASMHFKCNATSYIEPTNRRTCTKNWGTACREGAAPTPQLPWASLHRARPVTNRPVAWLLIQVILTATCLSKEFQIECKSCEHNSTSLLSHRMTTHSPTECNNSSDTFRNTTGFLSTGNLHGCIMQSSAFS
jgi:hypothetical protein